MFLAMASARVCETDQVLEAARALVILLLDRFLRWIG